MYQALECTTTRDPYQILGMPRSASTDDVRTTFRLLAKKLHPDVNRNDPRAAARFAELTVAHEILSNKDKRRAFDRGEIDFQGRPVRREMRRRSSVRHVAACLLIALTMSPVTTLIARSLTVPGAVITNSAHKGNLLPRFGEVAAVPANAAIGAVNPAMVVTAWTTTDTDVRAGSFAAQFEHHRSDFLVNRAEELISEGDIVAARILLQRAAEARDARAAFALGATYDPIMLAILRAHVAADVGLARDWYRKAGEFGSPDAQYRLKMLASLR
jgi:hypothetical protein